MSRSRVAAAVALAAALAGFAACGADDPGVAPEASAGATAGPRPVTPDEADRLAVARFNNYDRGTVAVQLRVPTTSGQVLEMAGRVDLREHRGLASFSTDDQPPSRGVLAWDLATVALLPTAAAVPAQALDASAGEPGWQARPAARDDTLDAALAVVLNLAADRPDNAQLLRQNGAQWVGGTTVAGSAVAMMTASPLDDGRGVTYYVDERGYLVRADIGSGLDEPASVTFLDGDAAALPRIPVLRASRSATPDEGQAG